jgi:GNAT superfamily N-acetyltransferase
MPDSPLANMTDVSIALRIRRPSHSDLNATLSRISSLQNIPFWFAGGASNPIPELAKSRINTDIHESVAFVATVRRAGVESEAGFGCYATNVRDNVRYMTFTVAEDFQRQGLASKMAAYMIQFARDQGIKELYSVAVPENRQMHELASELGMESLRNPANPEQIIYTLRLY